MFSLGKISAPIEYQSAHVGLFWTVSTTRAADEPGPITQAIAAEMRAEMAVQKMSARVLAERSGVGERSLARYLNAERTFSLETLDKLAQALGYQSGAELMATALARKRRGHGGPAAHGEVS